MIYTLCVLREFNAQHHLIGGDWGAENLPHSHPYRLELELAGPELDPHGYLVDIVEVERILDSEVAHYRNHSLNDLPAFAGLNPSLEHFARILCTSISGQLHAPHLTGVRVLLWESEDAWAAFEQEV
jgi:6-pyruvoyltetrahydropterin/6-carboxytetrahydropterin synthase